MTLLLLPLLNPQVNTATLHPNPQRPIDSRRVVVVVKVVVVHLRKIADIIPLVGGDGVCGDVVVVLLV